MKVLVVNCGSSSLKYRLFDMTDETILAGGIVERIGEGDHEDALRRMLERLTDATEGAVTSTEEIDAVGHRVVHGGEAFVESVAITDEVERVVEEQSSLAPLHNPPNLAGIRAGRKIFGRVPHVAVFDTAFHQTMPARAYLYALPFDLYEKHHVRRYGFHGTSHKYVARRAAKMVGKRFEEFSGVTCHLGNGCSMTAVENGRCVDTSMGITPLEGLMMGTRTGDMDPALPFFLARETGVAFEELNSLFNRRSGMLGVSGVSNDVRELTEAADRGHERARLALDMFAYRVKKYVGAYLAVLDRCDAIVFTGGIGENAAPLRRDICSGLSNLGVELDGGRNDAVVGTEGVISTASSPVTVLVIPTNEELEIARETVRVATAMKPMVQSLEESR